MVSNVETHRSGCPISCSLDLLGDKWSLLIVRDMVFGRKRYFKEFFASDEGIATNILTDRLKRLEDNGIVSKQPDLENRRQIVYTLTEKGTALIPVLVELLCWGAVYDGMSQFDLDKIRQIQQDTRSRQRFIRELMERCISTP